MSNYLVSRITNSSLDWGFEKSDHSSVKISLDLGVDVPTGPGLTKVNSTVLDDAINVAKVISSLNIMLSKMPADWNPHVKLEFVKVAIRSSIADLVGKNRKELRNQIDEND